MLGYDAHVHEMRTDVPVEELRRIAELPYEERMSKLRALTSRRVAYVPYRTWVDHLLASSKDGRTQLLHDGGYPYVFYAIGAEIKANFAAYEAEGVAGLADATWYIVEAWDQS